jgi:large repetitive protein
MNDEQSLRTWLGYDWFKTTVAAILAALLLYGGISGNMEAPVAVAPTAIAVATATSLPQPTAVPATAVPPPTAVALVAPTLNAPEANLVAGAVTLSGTGTPGSTVDVSVDGVSVGTATVAADGTWTLPDVELAAGTRSIVVTTLDSSGAAAAAAAPLSVEVGEAIAAPTIDALDDLLAGPVTLTGSGTPGSTIEVFVDGESVGTTTVATNGTWALENITLAEGEREITAEARADSAAPVAEAEPVTLAVGAAPLVAPTIDPLGADVNAGLVTVSGQGTPGSTIEVIVDGEPIGTTTVADDGTWSIKAELAEGERSISARVADQGAAAELASEALSVTIGPPVAGGNLVILSPLEGAELPAGPISVSGTGDPGTELEVLDSDQVLGETTVASDGTWEVEVTPDEGSPALGVRAKGSDELVGRPIRVTVGDAVSDFCNELAVGCQAWVTRSGGLSLRMRSGAGTDNAIIAKLPIGTQMELLEGPEEANDLPWYRVRTKGGQEGWVAGNNLVLQPD